MAAGELEERRRAIAAELRKIMAEPVERISPVEPDDLADEQPDSDPESDEAERPSVPPFEPAGDMSPTAARALFGHH
jgi:hypothetical protein